MTVIWCMIPEIWSATNRMFCHFGLLFALYPLSSQKNENFKNLNKKGLEISTFYTCIPKIMIICYTVPEIWCDGCNCYFSFWDIFCPFTPLTAQKMKISKKWKKKKTPGDVIILPKIMIMVCDRRTDRRKKWHIEVGVPPKKDKITKNVFSYSSFAHC